MATKTPKLVIIHQFTKTKTTDLLSRGYTVCTDMTTEAGIFTTPPVPITTVKQNLDTLQISAAAALNGSKKDMKQRDKDRHVVEDDLTLLAAYVLKIAGGDAAIVTKSGFELAPPRKHSTPQPLQQATMASVEQGLTGQLLGSFNAVPKAHSYNVRWVLLVNGVPAGDWTTVSVTSTKHPVTVSGLKPGSVYAFQVQALGKAGTTDWSDSVTRMVI